MALSKIEFSRYINDFKFRELFNDMGWNNDLNKLIISVDNDSFNLQAVAEKRGFKILLCNPKSNGVIPDYNTRKKIETKVTIHYQEHLIIYIDSEKTEQIWQLVVRQSGKPTKITETLWKKGTAPELLFQRAAGLLFELDEEENITIVDVKRRVSDNFHQNNEKVTKQFYDKFKKEHTAFLEFINGIPDKNSQDWYASLMLNRLMFCYFIQKKGFLDNNKNYLRDKLQYCKAKKGNGKFYSFYRNFLLVLFHKGLNEPTQHQEVIIEIGKIPYLNGGLFDEHEIEKKYSEIDIDDKAFERLFDFFDLYEWHLDTRQHSTGKDINPDVIGYIFEKYINDRANMGAYYTKEDITDYISKNCILPFLFDETKRLYSKAFKPYGELWSLVQKSGDQYIYDAVKKGVEHQLPHEIEQGVNEVSKRSEWNKSASPDMALPTEIWREVVARRTRYYDVKTKIDQGEISSINDFITYNLNIRQFVQDVIENTNDPEFLRHFYKALNSVTILDPTCGSGAFLFAAMNILEPLYEGCIQRMRNFIEDEDRENAVSKQNFNNKFKFFRDELERIQNPQHPNLEYYIYKSIILNNLFGVDIMKEAVEIAKLRLFLKLVATVEVDIKKSNFGLEPLPDIDFNIRAGNTLVGFATKEELLNTIQVDEKGQFKTDYVSELEVYTEECEKVAMAFSRFKEIQLSYGDDYQEFKIAKDELNNRLNILNQKLHHLLHKEQQSIPFSEWLQSHQPFHWFSEFYEIINNNGGFDVIIGNPPYVVYTSDNFIYKLKRYSTYKCSNLYAFCVERSFNIKNIKGRFGMIIPNSSISAEKMTPLQNLFKINKISWISNYSWRPSKLFEGADMLLAIILTTHSNINCLYSSIYYKWYNEFRKSLFENINYNECTNLIINGSIPKVPSMLYISILIKMKYKSGESKILNFFTNESTNNKFYYFRAVQYWVKILELAPIYLDNGIQTETGEMKLIHCETDEIKYVLISFLSSSLFFINYITWASCQVINSRDFEIPLDIKSMSQEILTKLFKLGKILQNDFKDNSHIIERSYKKKGREFKMKKQHFFIKKSKHIID